MTLADKSKTVGGETIQICKGLEKYNSLFIIISTKKQKTNNIDNRISHALQSMGKSKT